MMLVLCTCPALRSIKIGIALRLFIFPFMLYPLSRFVHKVVVS